MRHVSTVVKTGAVCLFAGGLAAAGCAGEVVEDDGVVTTGNTSTTTTTGGGGSTGSGGAGGEGNTGPCAMDCSTITTQDCFEAVCNTGNYPGPVGQCVVVPAEDGKTCDDGMFCTTDDTCQAGVCTGGPQNTCGMTAPPCNEITCNEGSKTCSSQAADDGSMCDPGDLCVVGATCFSGSCQGGTPKDCFFSPVPNECHVAVCNPANGMCEPQPGNDGGGCVDTMDLCTVNKTCSAGVCQGGGPKDCSGLTAGCNIGQCDTNTGQCTAMPVPNGGLCDDLNACTTGEICTNGTCAGGSNITACVNGDNCCPSTCNETNDVDCATCDWNPTAFPVPHSSGSSVGDMTFDDQCDLYFGTDSGSVWKVNRNTSTANVLHNFGSNIRGVTYHPGTNLIYATNQNKIFSMTKAGGNVTQLPMSTTTSWLNGIEVAPAGWGAFGNQLIVAKSTGEVVAFDPSTGQPTTIGTQGSANLSDLVFDNNTLYVAAYSQSTIYTMSSTGQFTVFASAGCQPDGLAVKENQFVYFTCGSNDSVSKAAIPGGQVTSVSGPGLSLSGGWAPAGIIFDGLDNLFVLDSNQLELFTP